jgi:hypothetical protein
MEKHSTIFKSVTELVTIYKHPRGREYALIPEHLDGWFLVLWEANGSSGRAWRVYAMEDGADLRRAEPKAEQSLEVFDDLWDVVTHVLDGKFTNKTTTR